MTNRERMEFSRSNLTIKESIGSGAFATVYKAEAFSIVKHGHTTTVAVKTLKGIHYRHLNVSTVKNIRT